jgi:hypothetical protein
VRSGRRGAQGSCWWGGEEGPWESVVVACAHGAVVILALALCRRSYQHGFSGKDSWSSVQCDRRRGPHTL